MMPAGNLLAWIKPCGVNEFVGAFVGDGAAPDSNGRSPGRAPAAQLFSSCDEAQRWVEDQAAALKLPIKWVSDIPRG
jgi:hypothetical protein